MSNDSCGLSLLYSSIHEASIYVVAPFRKVATAARKAVRELGLSDKIQCSTVHTFLSKEADIVFIVLGSASREIVPFYVQLFGCPELVGETLQGIYIKE